MGCVFMYTVEEYKVSEEELTNLLKSLLKLNTENEWIEFKVNNDNPSMIGEYISALANSAALCNKEHAYLIYGVDDKSKEVLGTDFDFNNSKKGNEPLYNWLYRKLKPQLDFTPYEIHYNTKRVLIIEIDKAKLYPIEFNNIAYIRIGQQKRKLYDYKEKEKKLWDMLNKTSFEEEVALSKLEIQDIFELLDVSTYYRMLELPLPENKEKVIEDFKEEGFLKELYGKLAITNLGAILFARNIHQFKSITRKSIRLIQYKNKDKLETIREINYDNGYAICFEEILKNLDLLTPQNEHIGLALRTQVKLYPEIALRELIANAMIHQDFTISGTSILIELFSNRIEISNPGTPLISIDRLIDHNPISRNEKLASIMRRFKICEEKGSGIDKVIKSIEIFQLPAPNFLEYDNGTKVIIYSYKKLNEMDRDDKLRACYQHACLQYVSGEKMTNESLRVRFNIEKKNAAIASRILSDATLSGLIKEYQPNSESRRYKSYLPYWA